jgi:hypothetical protein
MACIVRGCNNGTSKKALMCRDHWEKIPAGLRMDVRKGTEKGAGTLRAHPTREWVQQASKHVGEVKNLSIYVDATSKVKRKFAPKPEEAAA